MKESRTWLGREDEHHDYYARHPVMTPEMIRQLPAQYALIVRGGMSPVIARLPMAWKDSAYKAARRAGQATTVLTSVDEPTPLPRDLPRPRDSWHDTGPNGIPAAAWHDTDRFPWE